MARDVEFESERFERRRNARRFWLPAVVLLAMIAIAVTVALLTRSDRGGSYVGENTPYPFTWTEEKDGSITFEIDRNAADGYLWVISDASAEIVVMEADGTASKPNESNDPTILTVQPDKKQTKDKLRLVLKPESVGRAMFTLSLLNESDPMDRIAELSVLAETRNDGGKLNAYLISAGGKVYQGTVEGEGTNYAYIAQMNEYDNLVLTVISKIPAPEVEEEEPVSVSEEAEAEEPEEEEETEPPEETTETEPTEEIEEAPGEEMLYFGYTLEEFMELPYEVREELFAEQQAIEDAREAEEATDEEQPKGWECVSDNEDVAEVLDIVYGAEGVTAYLLTGELPGKATVKMTDPDSGTEVTLVCEVDANGDFLITSHSINQ